MSDDEQQQEAAAEPVVAAVATAEPAPAVEAGGHAGETFVLGENLDHNRVRYQEGAKVSGALFTAGEFAELRARGILKFEHEVAKAEDVAAQMAAKVAALTDAQAEIEALRRQLAEAQRAGGKSR